MSDIRTPDDEVTKPGYFYPPFRESWWYQGATYAGHSDFSVDWNRRTRSGGWLEDTGDPVLAAADGTVAEVDKANGLVMLDHWNGRWRTEYRHMQDIVVSVGEKVRRGDLLGGIGNVAGDGRSFGAHLHHVHWRKDPGNPWRRVQQRFYDKPVEVSVADSDTRPAAWKPPAPVMLQGPAPRATWESAAKDALKALEKAEGALAAQKAQTALATEERDQARRDLATMTKHAERLTADVTRLIAEKDALRARITELESRPADCAEVEDMVTMLRDRLDKIKALVTL